MCGTDRPYDVEAVATHPYGTVDDDTVDELTILSVGAYLASDNATAYVSDDGVTAYLYD